MSPKPLCFTDGGKPWTDKDRMMELHEEQDYKFREMADLFGCTPGTVSTWMKKHKAEEMREDLDVEIPDEDPHRDEDLMRTLYVDKEMSQSDISAVLGKSTGCIQDWLKRHDIETRSISEGMSIARGGTKDLYFWTNKAYGYEVFKSGRKDSFYHHRLLAVAEYGFEAVIDMDVHHKNGLSWDNRHDNLQLLTPSAHQRTENGYNWLDELRAVEMYTEGLSSYDISEVIGCSPGTAISWVRAFDEDLIRNGGAA